jgi:predicted Zn-dependent protease
MTDSLFYDLGRKLGPKYRSARWIWASMTASKADILRFEEQVGLDLAHEVRRQVHTAPDPAIQQAVTDVGTRLANQLADKRRHFQFEAYRASEPNAFALPGGFVFVSDSIFELCQEREDCLSFVLAHEMGHVVRGHAIERIATRSAISLARRVVPIYRTLGVWLANVGVRFLETAYSRDQEAEADRLAVRLVTATGYDPNACVELLSRLAGLSRSTDPLGLGRYFSTHPDFQTRIQSIRDYVVAHRLGANGKAEGL